MWSTDSAGPALRRRRGLRTGDRVLLVALPGEDTLAAYSFAVVDQAIRAHGRTGRGLYSRFPVMPDGPASAENRLQVVVGTGQVGCPRGGQKKRAGNLLDPWHYQDRCEAASQPGNQNDSIPRWQRRQIPIAI